MTAPAFMLPSRIRRDGTVLKVVLDVVCEAYLLTSHEMLKSRSRNRKLCWARFVAMHFAKRFTGMSNHEVGEKVGRHDTDVSYGCKSVRTLVGVYPDLKQEIDALETKIKERIRK